jgi:two-component system response regulator HydG
MLRRVLIVDDELDMAHCLSSALTAEPSRFSTEVASSGAEALEACTGQAFDVVVSDVRMSGLDGLELMTLLRQRDPSMPVVLITGAGSIPAAVDAVKRGAFHYLTKPCDASELRSVVERAATSRAEGGATSAVAGGPQVDETQEIIGNSPAMVELRARIELVAASSSPVLIAGETGTGKELVARAIHRLSPRRGRPFVTVNASAIPGELLESHMFGHVRGAFTGATQAHRGYFAEANGGTLFFDEIGDMPMPLQAKLLRALQSGEIRPVGADRSQQVDVRVLAATHQQLLELTATGRFRKDLYYRLDVLSVTLPPLRDRASDIGALSRAFLARARDRNRTARAATIRADLAEVLETLAWPGNVRELESTIERLVILARDAELTPEHLALLGAAASAPGPGDAADASIEEMNRRHVAAVLGRTDGDKVRAAHILGIDLSTLYRWQHRWEEAADSSGAESAASQFAKRPR